MLPNRILNDAWAILHQLLQNLHRHAWTIIFTTTAAYLCWSQLLQPRLHRHQSHQSYLSAIDPQRLAVLTPDMNRVRELQQQAARERALEAMEEKKSKVRREREMKRIKSPEEERWEARGGGGSRLGGGTKVA